MRFALMIEPQQGLSYLEQLAVARTAEAAGFETLLPITTPASREKPACRRPTPGRSWPALLARPSVSGSACSSRRSPSVCPAPSRKTSARRTR